MDAQAAVLSALSVRAAFSVISATLPLFALLFPKQAVVNDSFSYDFIIAGAGSAGCVLARRLSDDENFNVLLIEDGDDPTLPVMLPGLMAYNQRTKFDWNYTNENDHYSYQCYRDGVFQASRGHGLGGSSSINFMLYARGSMFDYQRWAEVTNDYSWTWDNILPFFKKSERLEDERILNSPYKVFHGTEGEMGIITEPHFENLKYFVAFNEIGYKSVLDTNGNDSIGFNFPMYNIAKGTRQSSCYAFLSPVNNRKNLHVLKNTKVTKIIFEDKVATGVEILTKNNETMALKAKMEVIISAGVFNSPQILMLSGIGPKEHLQAFNITTIADLPVGSNLQDHVAVMIAHQMERSDDVSPPLNPFKQPVKYINGFFALNKSQTYPDSQVTLIVSPQRAESLLNLLAFNFYLQEDIAQRLYDASIGRKITFSFIILLHPESRGRVLLRTANPQDPPKIFLEALRKEADIDRLTEYVKDYLRVENSTYFESVNATRIDLSGDRCKDFAPNSKEYWRCYNLCLMNSFYHYCGTCAMGTVVDSELRVKGVHNLRVVDASVFPYITSGNINAPVIAVAEKAADMIKRDHVKAKDECPA